MNKNPFTSDTFAAIWSSHFSPNLNAVRFGFLKNIQFFKHKFLPLYINNGRTYTKGVSYDFKENSCVDDIRGKVVLIYDVPVYFKIPEITNQCIKQYKIKQYPGFLINLDTYKDLNDFMAATFKKSSRYKLSKYKRKLETCFDIRYKMLYGEMTRGEYNAIFDSFYRLLTKRFDDKQVTNNNLDKEEWDFYHEVAYPMILEKKAGLFVVYNGDQPIGVTLCYFSDEILFDAITVFDIDYSKFHLGSVNIMKLVEWSIKQRLKIFDFSKGYFDYKKRWASRQYDFEYHILYDVKSLVARLLAFTIKSFFKFKQFLRDKHLNEKLHKLTYRLRNKSETLSRNIQYEFSELEDNYTTEQLIQINLDEIKNDPLRTIVYDFLYLNNESFKDLRVQTTKEKKRVYMLYGKNKSIIARPKN